MLLIELTVMAEFGLMFPSCNENLCKEPLWFRQSKERSVHVQCELGLSPDIKFTALNLKAYLLQVFRNVDFYFERKVFVRKGKAKLACGKSPRVK